MSFYSEFEHLLELFPGQNRYFFPLGVFADFHSNRPIFHKTRKELQDYYSDLSEEEKRIFAQFDILSINLNQQETQNFFNKVRTPILFHLIVKEGLEFKFDTEEQKRKGITRLLGDVLRGTCLSFFPFNVEKKEKFQKFVRSKTDSETIRDLSKNISDKFPMEFKFQNQLKTPSQENLKKILNLTTQFLYGNQAKHLIEHYDVFFEISEIFLNSPIHILNNIEYYWGLNFHRDYFYINSEKVLRFVRFQQFLIKDPTYPKSKFLKGILRIEMKITENGYIVESIASNSPLIWNTVFPSKEQETDFEHDSFLVVNPNTVKRISRTLPQLCKMIDDEDIQFSLTERKHTGILIPILENTFDNLQYKTHLDEMEALICHEINQTKFRNLKHLFIPILEKNQMHIIVIDRIRNEAIIITSQQKTSSIKRNSYSIRKTRKILKKAYGRKLKVKTKHLEIKLPNDQTEKQTLLTTMLSIFVEIIPELPKNLGLTLEEKVHNICQFMPDNINRENTLSIFENTSTRKSTARNPTSIPKEVSEEIPNTKEIRRPKTDAKLWQQAKAEGIQVTEIKPKKLKSIIKHAKESGQIIQYIKEERAGTRLTLDQGGDIIYREKENLFNLLGNYTAERIIQTLRLILKSGTQKIEISLIPENYQHVIWAYAKSLGFKVYSKLKELETAPGNIEQQKEAEKIRKSLMALAGNIILMGLSAQLKSLGLFRQQRSFPQNMNTGHNIKTERKETEQKNPNRFAIY